VVVSTGTKNLQEQIFFKDLPALRDVLGLEFSATLMKGRSNYLCLYRFERLDSNQASDDDDSLFAGVGTRAQLTSDVVQRPDHAVFLPIIRSWAAKTTTGDRAELRDLPEDVPVWADVAASAETCLGTECPRYGDCFVTLMRQRAAASDVVIVNHHLLCADAAVRRGTFGEVVPAAPTLIVDEAHQLEEVATQYFGFAVSNHRLEDFVRDAQPVVWGLGRGHATQRREELQRALMRVADRGRAFFAAIARARALTSSSGDSRARYTADAIAEVTEDGLMLLGALEGLQAELALARIAPSPLESAPETLAAGTGAAPGTADAESGASIERRAGELGDDLRRLLRADDPDFVYYVEARGRWVLLRASPIDVSRIVPDALFDRFRTVVLTSATLSVDQSFAYIRSRLGLREAHEIRVPSEFDYGRQALLYLPRRMPPPKAPTFAGAVARETIALLKRSRGRAFVLFTSYAVLRAVQPYVEAALPYPVLVQGAAPRSTLIDQFRITPNAVLLATSSFWQGVDVVGEALSCVIVDKLPFASPGDPVTAARIEAIKDRGGDAFAEYQVPLAILTLQQGLGRLIRHRTDRGVLAVLDPRLHGTGYGRRFLTSLPPAPITRELDAVTEFFK
jgi:ATP-dependent DNA helicase DinG